MWDRIKKRASATWAKAKAWFMALLVSLGLVVAMPAMAVEVTFSWTNPDLFENGEAYDAAVDQLEVRIYCDTVTDPFVSAGDATTLSADLPRGSTTCYATAVALDGAESLPSNSVTKIVSPGAPGAPSSFDFALN